MNQCFRCIRSYSRSLSIDDECPLTRVVSVHLRSFRVIRGQQPRRIEKPYFANAPLPGTSITSDGTSNVRRRAANSSVICTSIDLSMR